MGYIASWINDELQHTEAKMTIDDTFSDAIQEETVLEKFMPVQVYDTFDFVDYVVTQVIPTASVIAMDGELPTETFGQVQKITGELFKGGLSFVYNEKTQRKMMEAMRLAKIQNIAVQNLVDARGMKIKGSNDSLAKMIFGSVATMTRGLVRLLKVHSWTAVQFGVVNYIDPLTGARTNLDFRDPNADYGYAPQGKLAHFPAPLTGTARWTEYATANGLQDIRNWCRQFRKDTGRKPDAMGMSEDAWEHLKLQESTRQAYASVLNTAAGVIVNNAGLIGDTMLEELFKRLKLPMPYLVENEYWTRDSITKKRVKRRYLNENRVVFFCKGMGEQAIGPTIENDGQAGPYVITREIQKFPAKDATQGVATMLPVLPQPKLLFSRQVYDA